MNRFGLLGAVLAVGMLVGVSAFGAPATVGYDSPERTGEFTSLTMASNVIIYAGTLVCHNSAGLAVPAADTSGFTIVGRAEYTVDNRTAVYSATKKVALRRGVFRFGNYSTATAASIGSLAYVADDSDVATGSMTNSIIAGVIIDVDSQGVWVDLSNVGPNGAATPTSLGCSGNATVGGTLAVTGNTTLNGTLGVGGNVTLSGTTTTATNALVVSKSTTLNGTITANAAETHNGTLSSTNASWTLSGLPTSTNGLTTGRLWNNSNALAIMP
jgi:hypothetical protein